MLILAELHKTANLYDIFPRSGCWRNLSRYRQWCHKGAFQFRLLLYCHHRIHGKVSNITPIFILDLQDPLNLVFELVICWRVGFAIRTQVVWEEIFLNSFIHSFRLCSIFHWCLCCSSFQWRCNYWNGSTSIDGFELDRIIWRWQRQNYPCKSFWPLVTSQWSTWCPTSH